MPSIKLDWNKYAQAAIKIAREGSVLIKNDNEALPVSEESHVALFGRMQANYYKSGTGSGGMVNVNHAYDIREGLIKAGVKLDEELISVYDSWGKENPVDPGVGWGKERWSQDEMPVDDDFVGKYAKNNDTAIVVIARTAGEDRDNLAQKGSFYLTDEEENLIASVCKVFTKSVVLLNVGNIIDMSWVTKYNPAAVMYVWQAGMYGGIAVGDLVAGVESPSGILTDTIAYDLADYPAGKNFGNVDEHKDFYQEDIFVGYRYFSTFAPEKVQYPFGFGLSYTDFEIEPAAFGENDGDIDVIVEVTNTGDFPASKTVLLYADAPMGKLTKPARVLIGFAKTHELEPGDSEEVRIEAPVTRYASYDDDGRLGHGTGWMLEKGTYEFFIGGDVTTEMMVGSYDLEEDVVIENLKSALKPTEGFKRMTNDGEEDVPVRTHENIEDRYEGLAPEILQTGDKGIKLADVKSGKNTMDEFIAQLRDEDLAMIVEGEGMSSPKVTTGTAGAYGGISKHLMELGVPTLCCSDGPSGMRIDSGKKAFSLPNGACIASSCNVELIEELFHYFGIEMLSNEIDSILGPGMNIHRYPLNGRNFEYFSEDPVMTGLIGAAQLRSLHKVGVTAVIKHFCANNREMKRRFMDSVISEKALREIYLKGFEICVKEAEADAIMSVYNKVNGDYGTANYELNTEILRNQWGYTGIVMTDWWPLIKTVPEARRMGVELQELSYMVRAQCDIYMVCSCVEEEYLNEANVYSCLKEGKEITRAEAQRCARNILNFAMRMPAMDRLLGDGYEVEHIDCPFKDDAIEAKVNNYFKLIGDKEQELVIEIDKNTAAGEDFTFGLDCDTPGRYDVVFEATSELNPLAQIPMTVYVTSIPIRVVTWNGMDGGTDTRNTNFRTLSKYSVYRIHMGGAGVQLKSIKIRFRIDAEHDPDQTF